MNQINRNAYSIPFKMLKFNELMYKFNKSPENINIFKLDKLILKCKIKILIMF